MIAGLTQAGPSVAAPRRSALVLDCAATQPPRPAWGAADPRANGGRPGAGPPPSGPPSLAVDEIGIFIERSGAAVEHLVIATSCSAPDPGAA